MNKQTIIALRQAAFSIIRALDTKKKRMSQNERIYATIALIENVPVAEIREINQKIDAKRLANAEIKKVKRTSRKNKKKAKAKKSRKKKR